MSVGVGVWVAVLVGVRVAVAVGVRLEVGVKLAVGVLVEVGAGAASSFSFGRLAAEAVLERFGAARLAALLRPFSPPR